MLYVICGNCRTVYFNLSMLPPRIWKHGAVCGTNVLQDVIFDEKTPIVMLMVQLCCMLTATAACRQHYRYCSWIDERLFSGSYGYGRKVSETVWNPMSWLGSRFRKGDDEGKRSMDKYDLGRWCTMGYRRNEQVGVDLSYSIPEEVL